MKIILYSTGCPKCKVLKHKLEEKGISLDDKLTVVDTLIESIHVGHGKVKIAWKI